VSLPPECPLATNPGHSAPARVATFARPIDNNPKRPVCIRPKGDIRCDVGRTYGLPKKIL